MSEKLEKEHGSSVKVQPLVIPPCDIHEWGEEYYGARCKKCGAFIPDNGDYMTDEDDYDDYDANYPACTLCSCRINDEVPFGAYGITPGEVYCERCAEWSGLI
jgi:hypothetical protein